MWAILQSREKKNYCIENLLLIKVYDSNLWNHSNQTERNMARGRQLHYIYDTLYSKQYCLEFRK